MEAPNIGIVLPDGRTEDLPYRSAARDLFTKLPAEPKGVIGFKVGETLIDLQSPLTTGGAVVPVRLDEDSASAKLFYRHSFSHILAQAVKRLFPDAKLAIGPAIAEGFYYDFDVGRNFTPEDLIQISKEMKKIIKENHPYERFELPFDEARKLLEEMKEPYKIELLDAIRDRGEKISFYRSGEFVDLCRGPHVPSTNRVKYFELFELAGAYWRGDEKNKMLQRIYGTAFLKREDLEKYLWQKAEAKKRDHRKLGKDLDLYSTHPDDIGSGLVLWHPRGALVRHVAEEHCKRRHLESGYEFVYTPHVGLSKLWKTSGHLEFYKEGMFPPMEMDGHEYYMKPMNCPFHIFIYKSNLRSYRDLPIRYAEWGTVYRFERSGVVHGLTRARGFTQDDAHLFCRPDQMPGEVDKVLDFSLSILKDFGLTDFHMYLSTRPPKRVGEDSEWNAAEEALESALKRSKFPYTVNPGDGAFYGPKIDICVKDALEREWQLSTIQFDFNLPQRFDLSFIGEDGASHRPYMIHRALMGSVERFFGILVEHYAGAFPVWLAPVQVAVLPVAERHQDYAKKIADELEEQDLRVQLDESSNTLGYRIRNAQNTKVPYMLIIGDREVDEQQVSVRIRKEGKDLGAMTMEAFLAMAREKIETRADG